MDSIEKEKFLDDVSDEEASGIFWIGFELALRELRIQREDWSKLQSRGTELVEDNRKLKDRVAELELFAGSARQKLITALEILPDMHYSGRVWINYAIKTLADVLDEKARL